MKKMEVDETTCWYSKDLHIKANGEMGASSNLRPGIALKGLFKLIPEEKKTVIDLGCGNAKVSSIVGDRKYIGLDLSHNIETMCESAYPDLYFIKCDIVKDEIEFISEYDIVLMNNFIDAMQYPLRVLDKVLKNCRGYIVLHSQEIIEGKTSVIKNPSYIGFTYHSEIGRNDFNEILEKHKVSIVKEVDTGIGIWKNTKRRIRYPGEWRSFLLLANIE